MIRLCQMTKLIHVGTLLPSIKARTLHHGNLNGGAHHSRGRRFPRCIARGCAFHVGLWRSSKGAEWDLKKHSGGGRCPGNVGCAKWWLEHFVEEQCKMGVYIVYHHFFTYFLDLISFPFVHIFPGVPSFHQESLSFNMQNWVFQLWLSSRQFQGVGVCIRSMICSWRCLRSPTTMIQYNPKSDLNLWLHLFPSKVTLLGFVGVGEFLG